MLGIENQAANWQFSQPFVLCRRSRTSAPNSVRIGNARRNDESWITALKSGDLVPDFSTAQRGLLFGGRRELLEHLVQSFRKFRFVLLRIVA
jgi:hypothetical protein